MFSSYFVGLWLGLPDCLQQFDLLVTKFYKASDNDKRTAVVTEAEKEAEKIKDEMEKNSAEMYIKTMKKVLEKGESLRCLKAKISVNNAKKKSLLKFFLIWFFFFIS
jgi:endoplasmic reticulum protein 29